MSFEKISLDTAKAAFALMNAPLEGQGGEAARRIFEYWLDTVVTSPTNDDVQFVARVLDSRASMTFHMLGKAQAVCSAFLSRVHGKTPEKYAVKTHRNDPAKVIDAIKIP